MAPAVNKWLPEFEGGPAIDALLSRPYIAMADARGNVFIADREGHAIRKITSEGLIHARAGINNSGAGPDQPTPTTESALNGPIGLWVKPDGTLTFLISSMAKFGTWTVRYKIATVPARG